MEQTVAHVEKLREMSPLWEMARRCSTHPPPTPVGRAARELISERLC